MTGEYKFWNFQGNRLEVSGPNSHLADGLGDLHSLGLVFSEGLRSRLRSGGDLDQKFRVLRCNSANGFPDDGHLPSICVRNLSDGITLVSSPKAFSLKISTPAFSCA